MRRERYSANTVKFGQDSANEGDDEIDSLNMEATKFPAEMLFQLYCEWPVRKF